MSFTDIQIPEWAVAEGWTPEDWADLMAQAQAEHDHRSLDWAVEAYEAEENENGLTFAQWDAAASFGVPYGRTMPSEEELREAWEAGECPCDWAASLAYRPGEPRGSLGQVLS